MIQTQATAHTNQTDSNHLKAPIILGLEASGNHASVALVSAGKLVGVMRSDQPHGHASYFVSLASDCVAKAGLRFADITHIAAGVGPGSFTGLRVCLAAAKGFTLAGRLPGIGINGLRARAFAALNQFDDKTNERAKHQEIISCADTRRGVYFYQSYDETLCAMGGIEEASAEEIMSQAGSNLVIMPPDNLSDTHISQDSMRPIDMTASHIALLADYDLRHENPLAPLDALYVAEPKLGPAKKASSS